MSALSEREIKKIRSDIEKQITVIKRTGKLKYGYNTTIRALQRGEAKLVIMASGVPEDMKMMIKYFCALTQTPYVEFPGTSAELGIICGRPHLVAAVAVLDVGASDIMDMAKILSL